MGGRRVVITGIGIISPIGNDRETTWSNAVNGVSGIGPVTQMDASDYPSRIAGEVKDLDFDSILPKKEQRRVDRFSVFALGATQEAWLDAGITENDYDPDMMGSILGVGIGGLKVLEDNLEELLEGGPRKVSPFLIPAMITNLAPGNVAIAHNLRGVNYTVTSACTSGTHALGESMRMIRDGLQDVVVTGGTEAAITKLGLGGFGKMKALSTRNDDPSRASRPFDKDRDGFVIGEGSAILVLEEMEAAKKRGAKIYAEVVGYGFSCDAYHITAPSEGGVGAISSMRRSLKFAGLNSDQVDYVNAHGTSTPVNDPAETGAIKGFFGAHAHNGLLVSSTKSMTGHLLGAAGGIEAALCALMLERGIVLPTINLDNPDEGCDLDYVAKEARQRPIEVAMSNSFGFGGTNGTVVLRRV